MPAVIAPTVDLGQPLGGPDRRFSVVYAKFMPGHYRRSRPWSSQTDSLVPPECVEVDVGGHSLRFEGIPPVDTNLAANWDAPEYADAAQRRGKDFYLYALAGGGGEGSLLLSHNAGVPLGPGITAENSRKIAGFHCLCADVGTIAGHPLSGMGGGRILPASVWDLRFRPVAEPEGMVYVAGINKWCQIYLTNQDGGSTFGETVASNTSANKVDNYPIGSQYWFIALLARKKMRLLTDAEFQPAAQGSNTATSIAGAACPATSGGHVDTAGRRMISNDGLEDMCGAISQWLGDNASISNGETGGTTVWYDESGGNGAHSGTGRVLIAGGSWSNSTRCGPACRLTANARWVRTPYNVGRGCCETKTSY